MCFVSTCMACCDTTMRREINGSFFESVDVLAGRREFSSALERARALASLVER